MAFRSVVSRSVSSRTRWFIRSIVGMEVVSLDAVEVEGEGSGEDDGDKDKDRSSMYMSSLLLLLATDTSR